MPQSYTSLAVHLIFSTKNRLPQITPQLQARLHAYMGGIVRRNDCVPLQIGGVPDHVHLLIGLHPSRAVDEMVRLVKSNSSKWVHETVKSADFAWQAGYSAFSVSASNQERVTAYIANQERHHRKMTFKEEVEEFLKKHRVKYGPEIWD